MNQQVIPIVHSRIHAKLEEKANGNIIGYGFIVEWISRMIIKNGGLPRCDVHTTIQDLVNLGLLKKVSRLKFQLLKNNDKRLKPQVI